MIGLASIFPLVPAVTSSYPLTYDADGFVELPAFLDRRRTEHCYHLSQCRCVHLSHVGHSGSVRIADRFL